VEKFRAKEIDRVERDAGILIESLEVIAQERNYLWQPHIQRNNQDREVAWDQQTQNRGIFQIFVPILLIILSMKHSVLTVYKSNNFKD